MNYLATNLLMFYVGSFFVGFISLLTSAPLSVLIPRWFQKKTGTMLGIVFAGSGIGGIIGNPAVATWISNHGWRNAYLFVSLVILIIAAPCTLLIKERPEDVGQMPYGIEPSNDLGLEKNETILTGLTLAESLKRPAFWMVMTLFSIIGICLMPVYYNAPGYLTSTGIDLQTAALALSLTYFLLMLFKVITGVINDRFGIKAVVLLDSLSCIVAMIFLILVRTPGFVFAFAVFFGIALTWLSIPHPLVVSYFFGQKDFAVILGLGLAVTMVASAVSTPLIAFTYDRLHSYVPAFTVLLLLMILGVALILTSFRVHARDAVDPSHETVRHGNGGSVERVNNRPIRPMPKYRA